MYLYTSSYLKKVWNTIYKYIKDAESDQVKADTASFR